MRMCLHGLHACENHVQPTRLHTTRGHTPDPNTHDSQTRRTRVHTTRGPNTRVRTTRRPTDTRVQLMGPRQVRSHTRVHRGRGRSRSPGPLWCDRACDSVSRVPPPRPRTRMTPPPPFPTQSAAQRGCRGAGRPRGTRVCHGCRHACTRNSPPWPPSLVRTRVCHGCRPVCTRVSIIDFLPCAHACLSWTPFRVHTLLHHGRRPPCARVCPAPPRVYF